MADLQNKVSLFNIKRNCAQVSAMMDNPNEQSEASWGDFARVCKTVVDGETLIHTYSEGYNSYNEAETARKFNSSNPNPSCATIRKHATDPSLCDGCQFKDWVTSPIRLGRPLNTDYDLYTDAGMPLLPVLTDKKMCPWPWAEGQFTPEREDIKLLRLLTAPAMMT